MFDAEEGLQPGAPSVHPQGNLVGGKTLVVERGAWRRGLQRRARIPFIQMHAPVGMETRAAAEWDGDRLTVWKTSRAVHASDRQTLARVLDLPLEQVRVICSNMGGGFGNKDEGRLAVLVALLARKAGRPVRIEYSRAEEFVAGRNRQEAYAPEDRYSTRRHAHGDRPARHHECRGLCGVGDECHTPRGAGHCISIPVQMLVLRA